MTARRESVTSAGPHFSISWSSGPRTRIRPKAPPGSSVWAGRPRPPGHCTCSSRASESGLRLPDVGTDEGAVKGGRESEVRSFFFFCARASAWKGGKDVERRILYSCRLEEVHRFAEDRWPVVIETEDDARLHRYAMRMDPLNRATVVGHAVEALLHFIHAALRDGLQPDEQLLAAAAGGQRKELFVLRGMNACLAAPPLAMRSKSPEQRLGVLHVARDVVIPEDDHLAGERAVLFCDRVYGSPAHVALIHDGERAEIASIGAAARGKQNSTRVLDR